MKFVTFALVLLAQDDQEAPYQPKHKIEFTLAIEERDGAWQFVVEGTTDLPDAVMLRARTYALSEVDDYRGGKRIEEEGLSTDLDRAYHDFSPKNGRFREVAFESRRRPYSLPYRARIFYKPEEQDEAVAKEVGESQEFSFHADARRGTDADLDRELKETLLELTRDLEEIQRLFRDFRAAFIEQQKKFDEEAWNSWSSKWLERVKAVATRNEDRWLLWTVWLERQAQFRIEGFCSHFYQMAEECPRALKGDQEALTGL
ncbi:MAG: hypothetical protein HYY16_03635, partial [Planctomycetes bacterium]|nr:hypothetical protein [Planctomycetota bacterium]